MDSMRSDGPLTPLTPREWTIVPTNLNLMDALGFQARITREWAEKAWPTADLSGIPPWAELFFVSLGGAGRLVAHYNTKGVTPVGDYVGEHWMVWMGPDRGPVTGSWAQLNRPDGPL